MEGLANISINKDKKTKKKNILFFSSGDGIVGHWQFYDNNGSRFDSYELNHQNKGTHQFCQTFALIYAKSHNGMYDKDYIREQFLNRLKPGKYADNIHIVTNFWRYLFKSYGKDFTKWLIKEVRQINDEYISLLSGKKKITHRDEDYVISENTAKINLTFINKLFDEIDKNAYEISQRC